MAAAFCSESVSKFLSKVGTDYPNPIKDGGNRYWYTDELTAALDAKRSLESDTPQQGWRKNMRRLKGEVGRGDSAG